MLVPLPSLRRTITRRASSRVGYARVSLVNRAFLPWLTALLLLALPGFVQAQTCGQTSTFSYITSGPTGTRAGTGTSSTAGSANTYTDAVGGTSYTFNNYKKLGAGATDNFLVGTNANLGTAQTLYWQESYDNSVAVANNEADVTLTFNRAVNGLVMNLEDIDLSTTNPSTWRDQLTFNAYTTLDGSGNPTGAPIALSTANFTTGTANQYLSGNSVQGTANSAANSAAGNVTVTFPANQAIRAVTILYKNTQTLANSNGSSRLQIVGINSISWCAKTDVYAQFTSPTTPLTVVAGTSVTYTVLFGSNGPDAAAATTRTVTVPAGATITNSGGGTISGNTIDFGTITSPAGSPSNSFTYTYTAPATAGSYSNVATTSTTTDQSSTTNDSQTLGLTVVAQACEPSYLTNTTVSSGLTAEYYAGVFYNLGGYNANAITFFQQTAPLRRLDSPLDFSGAGFGAILPPATNTAADPSNFSARYRGSISIPVTGSYTFYLGSDDGSYLFLDNAALASTPDVANATIKNGGDHALITLIDNGEPDGGQARPVDYVRGKRRG